MGDRAIVACETRGRTYYLTAHPREWVLERAEAADLDADEARALAHQYGGTVVLLNQKREVRGEMIGRSNDRGPRQ